MRTAFPLSHEPSAGYDTGRRLETPAGGRRFRRALTEAVVRAVASEDIRLLEQLTAGLVVVDASGIVVRWNAQAECMLGVSAAQAIGCTWAEFFSEVPDEAGAGRQSRPAALPPDGWHGALKLRRVHSRSATVQARVQTIDLAPNGGQPASLCIFWPSNGEAAAEGASGSASGPGHTPLPYDSLFRASPDALMLLDPDGLVVDATDATYKLVNSTHDDVIGGSFESCLVDWTPEDTAAVRQELDTSGLTVRDVTIRRGAADQVRVEAIVSAVPQSEGWLVLVRLRDLTQVDRRSQGLRALGDLASLGDALVDIEEVARRALTIVTGTSKADASLVVLQDTIGLRIIAGPGTSETIRATFGGLDPAASALARRIKESDSPFEIDFGGEDEALDWASRGRAVGMCTLRSTPLWFGDRRLGAIVLLWVDKPADTFDAERLNQIARFAGLAIGNADLRMAMQRDAATRASLEGTARVGGVVLSQMTEAIVTTDADRRVTAVNPAAESLYGFHSEAVVGMLIEEIIEQSDIDGTLPDSDWTNLAARGGFWHGRAIHMPLVGDAAKVSVLVDVSVTQIHDERRRPAGLIVLSRETAASRQLDGDTALMSALALATSRARTRPEVASAVMERLCESTAADFGALGLWDGPGRQAIEASRGLSEESLRMLRTLTIPEVDAAIGLPGRLVSMEDLGAWPSAAELAARLTREGVAVGFLVDLRVRDNSIGFLALGSRRVNWIRPRDEVVLQAAAHVANAIENARLMERLEIGLEQERNLTSQLETLTGLTLLPRVFSSEEAVAQVLLERIVSALGADGGCVIREQGNRFRVVAHSKTPPSFVAAFEAHAADEYGFWRTIGDQPTTGAFRVPLTSATVSDPELDRFKLLDASVVVFPIEEPGRFAGAVLCYFSGDESIAQADERNIEAVGRIISIAYSNVAMSESLAEAAEHERRLTAELRALQELTLLGATTDDLTRLAQETIEEVVTATGASGGGYILFDPSASNVDPIVWVGRPSHRWAVDDAPRLPLDWPSTSQLRSDRSVWLPELVTDTSDEGKGVAQALLPLRVDDRLAGALHLEWADTPPREQYDVHFLEPIARITSISLANFRLRAELVHRAAAQRALGRRLDTINELTLIGEEASSFDELAHRTVSLVRDALGATGVCYLLIEPGHHFETHAVAGETGAFRLWLKGVPAKEAPGGTLLLSGGSSVLGDFAAGQVNERVLPLARAAGFQSFGAIPIRTGDELAGALLCLFEPKAAMLPLDEAALDSVARIAGIALANYRLRERLVSSEERYRTLFEESPDALLVSALDGTVLDANEAAVRLYRVNRGEILGRYFGQFICADEREMARRRQIVWAQGRGTFRDRGRRTDGSEFPVEVEVRVVELGGQRRFLQLVRDLSDQERLHRELLQAQKMEAIGQLVSGVAHELNNPLAAIIAFSQLLRGDPRLPEDMRHDAGLLVQEADRTRRIVQNLLDFARARPPERRPTGIGVLVQSVLELQSYALNTNAIQVKVDIPTTIPDVDLDRAQLQQVLLNLTINAIQAFRGRERRTPATLWITAALVKPRSAGVAARNERLLEDQQRVRVTIRDDGPGVPEAARERLFLPFFTTKAPGEGTGLGLSVSFGIVAAHFGHLWYEPGPGNVGSSFIIELPVSAQPTADDAATDVPDSAGRSRPEAAPRGRAKSKARASRTEVGPAAPPASAIDAGEQGANAEHGPAQAKVETRRPRVLALDDEPSIRVFLQKALNAAGMDCSPFPDGAQALEGMRNTAFDVMLVDHRMAGMSGTEFYESAIDLQPELTDRVVFMSGDVLNPDLSGFATQRGIRLLAKPFDLDAVIRIVREVLAAADAPDTADGDAIAAPTSGDG